MNDPDPFDGPDTDLDTHLGERLERAVGGLRAPDVLPAAMARGRRQRTHRRLAYGAGSLAAATALVLTVPAFADGWAGQDQDSSAPEVAADPAPTSPAPTSPAPTSPAPTSPTPTSPTLASTTQANPDDTGSANESCSEREIGWWSKSTAQIEAELSALLPQGIEISRTQRTADGDWSGNLATGNEEDGAGLTLLPPPGVLGPWRTLAEVQRLGPCGGGSNEPSQAVQPCDEITGVVACEEIRSEDGALTGVVTETVRQTVVVGRDQPVEQSGIGATLVGPEGGHVYFRVGEGLVTDTPDTVYDPADVPALTTEQVVTIVTDPFWTS